MKNTTKDTDLTKAGNTSILDLQTDKRLCPRKLFEGKVSYKQMKRADNVRGNTQIPIMASKSVQKNDSINSFILCSLCHKHL